MMDGSWVSLEKGDTIHGLIYNSKTFLYEYQEIKIKRVNSFPACLSFQFKFTQLPEYKRKRETLMIENSSLQEKIQWIKDKRSLRYGCNLFSPTKEDLREGLGKLLLETENTLKKDLEMRIKSFKFFMENIKLQNPIKKDDGE